MSKHIRLWPRLVAIDLGVYALGLETKKNASQFRSARITRYCCLSAIPKSGIPVTLAGCDAVTSSRVHEILRDTERHGRLGWRSLLAGGRLLYMGHADDEKISAVAIAESLCRDAAAMVSGERIRTNRTS